MEIDVDVFTLALNGKFKRKLMSQAVSLFIPTPNKLIEPFAIKCIFNLAA